MMYIYIRKKELFPVLSALSRCGFNDADLLRKAHAEIEPESDLATDFSPCELTLTRTGETPIVMLVQSRDGASETVSLENGGDSFSASPFILWEGLEHFHPEDHGMFPTLTVDGVKVMLVEYGLSARLGEDYAEIQWAESHDSMEMEFQTDSEIRRRVLRGVEAVAPKAKVLFYWPHDGETDWYQIKSRRTAPDRYESFALTTGPSEEVYDIDVFVKTFDRFTELNLLTQIGDIAVNAAPSELCVNQGILPGVSFAQRTSPQVTPPNRF